MKNAAVPSALYPRVPPEPLITAFTAEAPKEDNPVNVKPLKVGESVVSNPKSISLPAVPFVVSFTVPCDVDEIADELTNVCVPFAIGSYLVSKDWVTCSEPLTILLPLKLILV